MLYFIINRLAIQKETYVDMATALRLIYEAIFINYIPGIISFSSFVLHPSLALKP
jgi:hypothetical protein